MKKKLSRKYSRNQIPTRITRNELLGLIAYAIDHPEANIDFPQIHPKFDKKLSMILAEIKNLQKVDCRINYNRDGVEVI